MQRRDFLKGLLAVGGGIVIPSTRFIFDYGANSYKSATPHVIMDDAFLDAVAYLDRLYLSAQSITTISYGDVIASTEWEFKQNIAPVGCFGGILRSS